MAAFRAFAGGIWKRWLIWAPPILLDVPDLYTRLIAPVLPPRFQLSMLEDFAYGWHGIFLVLVLLLWAAFLTYKELYGQSVKSAAEYDENAKVKRERYRDLTRRLEENYELGKQISDVAMKEGTAKWLKRYGEWYESTLALVAEVGSGEQFLFSSIAPKPQKRFTYMGIGRYNKRDMQLHIQLRLDKLRKIIGRCHNSAEGGTETGESYG